MAVIERPRIKYPEGFSLDQLGGVLPPLIIFSGVNKALSLSMDHKNRRFETNVSLVTHLIIDDSKPVGVTTELYEAAHGVMRQVADLTGHTYSYEFRTWVESMKHWAKDPSKGLGIFGWEIDEKYTPGLLIARTTINPISNLLPAQNLSTVLAST